MDTQSSTSKPSDQAQYVATFKNGALVKLKQLAASLGISEDNIGDVLIKGMKIIDLASGGKLIIEKDKERIEVDIKKL